MRTTVRGINLELTKAIVKYAKGKFQNMNRYFDHINNLEIIICSCGKMEFQVEVLGKVKGRSYVIKTKNEDLYSGLDHVKLKMKELLVKEKNKIIDKKRTNIA
jgi:putative sigma-54 modulation protein